MGMMQKLLQANSADRGQQRKGVYSGGGCERGGRVKSRWRKGRRFVQRIRPQLDEGAAGASRQRHLRQVEVRNRWRQFNRRAGAGNAPRDPDRGCRGRRHSEPPRSTRAVAPGVPGISLMASPLKEVAAAVPRPPAGAALPHGIAAGAVATRRAVTLGRTPVDSLDLSRSISTSTFTSLWQRDLDLTSLSSLKQIQNAHFCRNRNCGR